MRNLEIFAVHEGNTINVVDIELANGSILKGIPYFDEDGSEISYNKALELYGFDGLSQDIWDNKKYLGHIQQYLMEQGVNLGSEERVYLILDWKNDDIFVDDYNSLEEANAAAKDLWEHLTKLDKKNRKIEVITLKQSDYELVESGETEAWYLDFAIDEVGTYNSNLVH